MMQSIETLFSTLSGWLWGWPMIILLLGTHLFLTIRLRFPPRYILRAIRLSVQRDKDAPGEVSQFGALVTSLAATIGTGNIIGVATAVTLGGPGAVLWCWLTGVLGIATKYGEGILSIKYRERNSRGEMIGGPMFALEKGLGMKWLAVLFAIFTAIASFGIGNAVQANAIATLLDSTFAISPSVSGVVMAILVALVLLFGVRGIAQVCTALVPLMAGLYIVGCLIILVMNAPVLGDTVSLIWRSAFSPQAAGGGFLGSTIMMAMRFGIARGLFSNESGLGSSPIVAAAAQTKNPVRQALVSASGTFWDTVVICALTGLVLVSSVIANPEIDHTQGAALTQAAFSQIPYVGSSVLLFGIVTFAFSTILGWSYCGIKAVEYLGGVRSAHYFRLAWVVMVFLGSTLNLKLVWDISDSTNALMAIPNLISLLLLSGVLVRETRKYLWSGNLEQKEEPPTNE